MRKFSIGNPYRAPAVILGVSVMLAMLFAAPAAGMLLTSQKQWQFEVYLDDKAIGEHTFSVRQDQGIETIRTEASFDVKVLFVTAFSYDHENIEVWRDGCLAEIDATTVINGKRSIVRGQQKDKGFTTQVGESTESYNGCVSTFAYWDPNFLNNSQLLNSQTGELEAVEVRKQGKEPFDVAGNTISADRFEVVVDDTPITLWYASDGRWLGLETVASGGRALRYEPKVLPQASLGSAD